MRAHRRRLRVVSCDQVNATVKWARKVSTQRPSSVVSRLLSGLNPFPLWHLDAVAGRGRPSHYLNFVPIGHKTGKNSPVR